jgi:hypothetical protein
MADVQLCADRFPALLLVMGIWSMFDADQVMNMSSGAGFASAPDPTAGAGIWFEAIYPQHTRYSLRRSTFHTECCGTYPCFLAISTANRRIVLVCHCHCHHFSFLISLAQQAAAAPEPDRRAGIC